MPPTVLKQPNGSFIVKDELTDEVDYLTNLRAYELRLRDMKATRVKPLSAVMINQRAANRIKARKEQEARVKQQEKEGVSMIRNMLARGLQPSEIRRLFASLEEIDRNAAMWKYIDSQVTKGGSKI